MKHYLINKEDIETCNKNGIVACWSSEHDKPVVVKSAETDALFSDKDIVEISEVAGTV